MPLYANERVIDEEVTPEDQAILPARYSEQSRLYTGGDWEHARAHRFASLSDFIAPRA